MKADLFREFCRKPRDPQLLEEIYKFLYRLLRGGVFRMGGTEDDFEEIANETLLVLLSEIPNRGITDLEDVKRFAVKVLRYRFLNLRRSTKRMKALLERFERAGPEIAETIEPSEQVMAREFLEMLEDLDRGTKTLLHERLVQGLPYKEMAARRGTTDGNVRVMVHKAIKTARAFIRDKDPSVDL